MESAQSVRMDKWLWAVRLFKTRSQAAAACAAGKVQVNEQPVKASRSVKISETIVAATGELTRTVKVVGLLEHRVGAKLIPQYLEDLTPPEEYAKQKEKDFRPLLLRPKGSGRPTKKDRRSIEGFFN